MSKIENLRSEGFKIKQINKFLELKALYNTEGQRESILNHAHSLELKKQTGPVEIYAEVVAVPDCVKVEKLIDGYFEDQLYPFNYALLAGKTEEMTEFEERTLRMSTLKCLGFKFTTKGLIVDQWDHGTFSNINYKTAKSPNDPNVFLIRTSWPNPEHENSLIMENLLVAQTKEDLGQYMMRFIANVKKIK